MLGIFSADDILRYFSYFSQKIGFDIACKLSPRRQFACNVDAYFSEKKVKENTLKMSSAEFAQRMVKVKCHSLWYREISILLYELQLNKEMLP